MIAEIVATGTELLLGQIVNTNAVYLAQQLNEQGFDVLFQSTVGDNRERMAQVLRVALERADIVVTTGGLGPTNGDITKEVAAQLLGKSLYLHEESVRRIQDFFAGRQLPMPESNLRQAMMPAGSIVLDNDRGTAPGVVLTADGKTIIHLPGPPPEMEWMFQHKVMPYLQQHFGDQGIIVSRVLHTYGLGESALEEQIKDFILAQSNPTIALLARPGEIIVRLTARQKTADTAQQLLDELERELRRRIDDYVFGVDDDTMEAVAARAVAAKKFTLALAESCTGGLVTSRLTDVPGSSDFLTGSVVCYSNAIKIQSVGVPADILAQFGAVSRETAVHMAQGIRKNFATDIGIGITGIAGPDGATADKPVGLVYIAIDGPQGVQCCQNNFSGARTAIKFRTSQTTLNLLRQYVSAE